MTVTDSTRDLREDITEEVRFFWLDKEFLAQRKGGRDFFLAEGTVFFKIIFVNI